MLKTERPATYVCKSQGVYVFLQKKVKENIEVEAEVEGEEKTKAAKAAMRTAQARFCPQRLIPPTADEVSAYCISEGFDVDASRFTDYYASIGGRLVAGKWWIGKRPFAAGQAAKIRQCPAQKLIGGLRTLPTEETAKLLSVLKTAYPHSFSNLSPEDAKKQLELWATMFADDSVALVAAAIKYIIATDPREYDQIVSSAIRRVKREVFAENSSLVWVLVSHPLLSCKRQPGMKNEPAARRLRGIRII